MKLLSFLTVSVILWSAVAGAAQIRMLGDIVLLSGSDYTVKLDRADGTILSVKTGGRDLTLAGQEEGLWKAGFSDRTALTAKQAGKAVVKQEGNQVSFTYDTGLLVAAVTVTAQDDYVDFQGEVMPKKQPVITFSVPGRLNFTPKAVDGVVCHLRLPGASNPGTVLRAGFFAPGAADGVDAYWRQSAVPGSRCAEILFGGPFQNLGDKRQDQTLTVTPEASQWLGPEVIEALRVVRLTPSRPFGRGQAEIALLRHNDDVVFGGSRFGGKGAFFRWGAFIPGAKADRTIMEVTVAMVRRLLDGKRLEGKRRKVALIALHSESPALPVLSDWMTLLKENVPGVELIEGAADLEAAIRSPETAVIINPYNEYGIATPGESLPEFMKQLKEYVRAGGYWFDTSGYSFYYQLSPAPYLSSGLNSSPGSVADFFHLGLAGRNAALYAVQPTTWRPFAALDDSRLVFQPSAYELGGEPRGGFLDRAFVVYAEPGKTFRTPVSRLRFHADALESLRHFVRDNRISRRLEDKTSPELIEKVRNSVLFHPVDGKPSTAKGIREVLPLLPVPCVVHVSQYLKGSFDKEYPDHLPPNRWWGTMDDFRTLVTDIKRHGMLFMPYTNNTWWGDHPRGPTFLAAGDAPLQRGLDGKPIPEWYGNHGGWSISMWHPAVRAANDKIVGQFTGELPSDILFQDQTGVRGGVSAIDRKVCFSYDRNPAAPVPHAVVEGFLSQMRRDAARVPLATEEGWWGLIDGELMFCGFSGGLCHFMEWQGDFNSHWPKQAWNFFPMIQALAHDKAFLTHHDLAADVDTQRRISWTLALGFNMVSRADPLDPARRQWLLWLDRLQKSVCARYAGGGLAEFRHDWGENGEIGVLRAVYGPVFVTANLQNAPLRDGRFTIAPDGFLAVGGGVTAGDLLACGAEKVPGFFVTEKGRAWLYAAPGTEAAFPVERIPAEIRLEGRLLKFHGADGWVTVTLPLRDGAFERVWELELI